jgi:hypothetical protein
MFHQVSLGLKPMDSPPDPETTSLIENSSPEMLPPNKIALKITHKKELRVNIAPPKQHTSKEFTSKEPTSIKPFLDKILLE